MIKSGSNILYLGKYTHYYYNNPFYLYIHIRILIDGVNMLTKEKMMMKDSWETEENDVPMKESLNRTGVNDELCYAHEQRKRTKEEDS